MGDLLLGVDGGNTTTIAVVAGTDGTVVGVGTAGRGDIHNAPSPDAALDEINRACAAALASAGVRADELAASAFSLAGADWPEDFELLRGGLARRLELATVPLVVNDAIGAIRCGTDDGVGVAVVCGTHGTAGARNGPGDMYHFGFWPDDTGASGLGSEALAAVWRADLGIGPETSLTGRALARWRASDPIELLHNFTRLGEPRIPASERALFAEAVLTRRTRGTMSPATSSGWRARVWATTHMSLRRGRGNRALASRSCSAAVSCVTRPRCCASRSLPASPTPHPSILRSSPSPGPCCWPGMRLVRVRLSTTSERRF